ncbi:hypothetical protein C365_05648 [Cryptococcus neoformans Bt85]|nr:hypothetical protein C365_05648 [Cryptococcus neoformans var. grubii Bt85]OXM76570.1 hypothetical protein C364_05648 [Cryptococcus neoformans var. grubii Bt63]
MDVSRPNWYVVADLDRGGLPVSRWVFSRLLVTDGFLSQEKMDEFIGWDSNISLPDIIVPSVVPATPAPQTELTAPSGRVIPKTPKTPGKPRKKSSNSKTPRSPKSPSKKGSLKDSLFSPRVVSSS